MKPDNDENLDFYRNLNVHTVGIPKDKTPSKAFTKMTDAELVAFYSEKYMDVDDFLLKNRKDRISGFCNIVKESEFFLDVGCASGTYMEILHQKGIQGIGLDVSIPNILRGRLRYPHLKFIHGYAEEIPFKDEYFDVVLLSNSIGHFRNPEITVAECLRTAKKGLVIYILNENEQKDKPINPLNDLEILNLLEFYKLNIHFFKRDGHELSREEALSKRKSYPEIFIRAEKTADTNTIVKDVLNSAGKKNETKAKEEILSTDQWAKDFEHDRHETVIARFKLVSHLIEGNRVLEIGCGNGDGSIEMAKNGFNVIGIDISESGIRQANEIALKKNVQDKINFLKMDATKLKFSDNSFDTIVIPEVLEHIRSPRKILEEAIRVVRNGGRIIISVPDGLLIPWEGHLRIFFKDTFITELSQYAEDINWHKLPFKKWLICSFFVKKKELNINTGHLIDIVMPTFNGRKTIIKAINSVIGQTYQNWNLIIINDGGESVCDIVKQFNDNRIKYFDINHKGKSHALNIGLQNSNSDYVTFLDDDDILYPLHLEILIKGAVENKKDFVYADWYEVSINEEMHEFDRKFYFRTDVSPSMLLAMNYINHKCILHKRSLLEKTGLYDESLDILIDWDMIRRLAFVSYPFHLNDVTSEHLVYYDKGILMNRISGLWYKKSELANQSNDRILRKTEELPINLQDSKKIIVDLLLSNLELRKSIKSKDIYISNLSYKIEKNEEFERWIKNSFTFNFLLLYDRFIFRFFPINSRRRYIYESFYTSFRNFARKIKNEKKMI